MKEFMNGRVVVKVGDITREPADAVVNAANSSLLGGGGVDGAIHRAGGPAILEECRRIRKDRYPKGLPAGQAVATTAGNLPAKFVIHTVGPVWHGGSSGESELLAACYRNSLAAARAEGCRTVAFPAISTGVYGYPRKEAAKVSSGAVKAFLAEDDGVDRVVFVFFSGDDAGIFLKEQVFE